MIYFVEPKAIYDNGLYLEESSNLLFRAKVSITTTFTEKDREERMSNTQTQPVLAFDKHVSLGLQKLIEFTAVKRSMGRKKANQYLQNIF